MLMASALQFFMMSFLICLGFSFLGLSSVIKIFLQYLFAIFPIIARFFLSLSPPHPNTITIFFLNCFFNASKLVSSASGVCAKSIIILELLFKLLINSNLPGIGFILYICLKIFFKFNPQHEAARTASNKFLT